MITRKNGPFSTTSLIKLPNTFELSTISSFQNNSLNLKKRFCIVFLFYFIVIQIFLRFFRLSF
jgi:hypothetical protein